LAAGYLENNRFIEAEEVSNRAVARTKGKNVWAIYTLCCTYLIQGRSFEVLSLVDKYEGKHDDYGKHYLLFVKGLALVQTGNYLGACKVVDDLLESIENSIYIPVHSIANTSLLIWCIKLNSSDNLLDYYASSFSLLSDSIMPHIQPFQFNPILDTAFSMGFAAAACAQKNGGIQSQYEELTEEIDSPEKKLGSSKVLSDSLKYFFSQETSSSGDEKLTKRKSKFIEKQKNIDTIRASNFEALFESHLAAMQSRASQRISVNKFKFEDNQPICDFRHLTEIIPTFDLNQRVPEMESLDNNYCWVTSICSIPLAQHLFTFCEGNFQKSALSLKAFRPLISRLGGHIIQRDIIEQTTIDSLLLSDFFEVAKVLLRERYYD
jgi:hypothetical protein